MKNKVIKFDLSDPHIGIIKNMKNGQWVRIKDHKAFVKKLKRRYKKLKKKILYGHYIYLRPPEKVCSTVQAELDKIQKEQDLCKLMVDFVIKNYIQEKTLINYKTVEINYLELKDVEELIRIVTGIKPNIRNIILSEGMHDLKDSELVWKRECEPFESEKPKREFILIDVSKDFSHYDESTGGWYKCPECGHLGVGKLDEYCPNCRNKLEWTGIDDGINKPN